MTTNTSTITTTTTDSTIRQLPKDVVDRIAAGEVVARPANALKELLENSLDAGATKIMISVDKSANNKKSMGFSISDNGCGISLADLPLAATRFATSKLTTVDDFQSLSSFGFRGEALASISMVSHLTITSRTPKSNMAYECSYTDGKCVDKPKRCARTPGTTVVVKDLFYNVPHRLKALREEYPKILQLLQPYAVQVARKGVGMIVQQQQAKKPIVDLNTTHLNKLQAVARDLAKMKSENDDSKYMSELQKEATQQAITNIYGSFLQQHLIYFQSESNSNTTTPKDNQQMKYSCEGFLTSPSLASSKQQPQLKQASFLLFVNDRQVDCPPLKRQIEDVYASLTPWKKPPFVYLSIQVPPTQVDVNVHPSKLQVALLFLEDIVADIVGNIQQQLEQQGKTFGEKQQTIVENPYRKKPKPEKVVVQETNKDDNSGEDEESKKRKRSDAEASSSQSTQPERRKRSTQPSSTQASSLSQLVRTHKATPVGALEPFLVKRQVKTPSTLASTPSSSLSQQSSDSQQESTTPTSDSNSRSSSQTPKASSHQPNCPLATQVSPSIDLNQPGAFAQVAKQCTCREEEMESKLLSSNTTVLLPTQARVMRQATIVPTDCPLASIRTLRKRVQKRLDSELQQKLRQAYFVGVLSEHRSLIQYQEELCMIHHSHLLQAFFYQLALARFGGNRVAKLGAPIHIQILIEQWLQMEQEDELNTQSGGALAAVSKSDQRHAAQTTARLADKADMLEEYFGIIIEKQDAEDEKQKIVLTGLPILLEGHSPPPHGLPLFLLRLATEVDWEEERPCFDNVCRELGYYYAQLGGGGEEEEAERKAQIQHTLFPALASNLMPSEELRGDVKTLTLLSNLYKVFERC